MPDTHPITLHRATVADAADIVRLRDAVAAWLLRKEIVQWHPGEVGIDEVAQQIRESPVYLARQHGTLVGSFHLTWADPVMWGRPPGLAGYVHRLMTDPEHAPRGLGRHLLSEAEHRIRDVGRDIARLDCNRANQRLRAYYRAAGYREVGEREFRTGWYPVTLFEKQLPRL